MWGAAYHGSSAKGRNALQRSPENQLGDEVVWAPFAGPEKGLAAAGLSGVPRRGRKGGASVPGSVPASRAASKSVSACLPRGTDCCLFLLRSSVIGLTFGNHFSFFGNFFLDTPTYPVIGGCGGQANFPKKEKKFPKCKLR